MNAAPIIGTPCNGNSGCWHVAESMIHSSYRVGYGDVGFQADWVSKLRECQEVIFKGAMQEAALIMKAMVISRSRLVR